MHHLDLRVPFIIRSIVTKSGEPEPKAGSALGTILLVSAAFPPWTVVGAARWEGFAPYLNAAGWRLSVLAEEPPLTLPTDSGRVARLGVGVSIRLVARRIPAWRDVTLRLLSKFRKSRQHVEQAGVTNSIEVLAAVKSGIVASLHPRELFQAAVQASSARFWIHDLCSSSKTFECANGAAMVISSGPPHDAHIAAAMIAAERDIPHVVDLRDPWTDKALGSGIVNSMLGSPMSSRRECKVLSRASAIIVNTPSAAAALTKRLPQTIGRVHAVLNGSDSVAQTARVLPHDADYLVVHTGELYLDRDPRPFLRALALVRSRNSQAQKRLRVVFMGNPAYIAKRFLSEWANDYGLADCFEERPFGTRAAATALMEEAAMLVAFQGATPTQIPAKLFDYASNAATILALTGSDSATAAVLSGTDALVAPIDGDGAIAEHIESAFSRAISGVPIVPINADGRFARSIQAGILLQILKKL